MRVILFISGLIATMFILGCNKMPLKPTSPIIIERKCPKIVTLRPIPKSYYSFSKVKIPFKRTDNPGEIIVEKRLLKMGSINSQKKDILIHKMEKYIKFYEKQNIELLKLCKPEVKEI